MLWGGGLFGFRGHLWWAVFFGAFPDLFSFGLLIPIELLSGNLDIGRPDVESIPGWINFNYDLLHSLLVALAALGMTALWRKDLAYAMLAWPFHILLDIPFHAMEYFPTKYFWPLSDRVVDGIAWDSPWVWFPNLAGIFLLYFWRWRTIEKRDTG